MLWSIIPEDVVFNGLAEEPAAVIINKAETDVPGMAGAEVLE